MLFILSRYKIQILQGKQSFGTSVMLTANLMLAVLIWVNDCAMCGGGGGGGVYHVIVPHSRHVWK